MKMYTLKYTYMLDLVARLSSTICAASSKVAPEKNIGGN